MQVGMTTVSSASSMSNVRFTSFPRTQSPPNFARRIVAVFQKHEPSICTRTLAKGLTSDAVLAMVCSDLQAIGFTVELGKNQADKIRRPVFFGENGEPGLQYEIDAFHDGWKCGLEIEAGRGGMGNALYRDLIQALVMVELEVLVLAVANTYKYSGSVSRDYDKTVAVADALYGHSRIKMPYQLVVVGY